MIDNTSQFRIDADVPLVVPEVNRAALKGFHKRNIIANPNCSTIQMVVALKPLHDIARIKRIVVATYQSVSGAGKEAMDELFEHTKAIYMNDRKAPAFFPKAIPFNVIPQIDVFLEDGSTKEEWKMVVETRKILDPKIDVTATCVRVPVFVGHAEAVNVEFESALGPDEARAALREAEGVVVVDGRGEYITPIECVGEYGVFVSRIRKDPTVRHGLNLWVVSDNLRKGAALNAVQIAEAMVADGLIWPRRSREGRRRPRQRPQPEPGQRHAGQPVDPDEHRPAQPVPHPADHGGEQYPPAGRADEHAGDHGQRRPGPGLCLDQAQAREHGGEDHDRRRVGQRQQEGGDEGREPAPPAPPAASVGKGCRAVVTPNQTR